MAPSRFYTSADYAKDVEREQLERQAVQPCGFCKRNREAPAVYMTHPTKDSRGKVVCPQLRRYICPGCGATGDDAHTRSYCPSIRSNRQQQQQQAIFTIQQSNNNYQPQPTQQQQPIQGKRNSSPPADIQLGRSQALNNMSRVTSSRYNSAGRLRYPPTRQAPGQQPQQANSRQFYNN